LSAGKPAVPIRGIVEAKSSAAPGSEDRRRRAGWV